MTELTAVEEVEDITEIVTEDEVDDDEEEEDDDEDTQQASVSLKQRFTVSSSEEENSSSCDSFKRKRTTTPAPITQYSKVESDFSVSEAEEVVDSTALVESFSEYSSSCDSFKMKRTTTLPPITQYSKVESDFSVSEAEEVVDSQPVTVPQPDTRNLDVSFLIEYEDEEPVQEQLDTHDVISNTSNKSITIKKNLLFNF